MTCDVLPMLSPLEAVRSAYELSLEDLITVIGRTVDEDLEALVEAVEAGQQDPTIEDVNSLWTTLENLGLGWVQNATIECYLDRQCDVALLQDTSTPF